MNGWSFRALALLWGLSGLAIIAAITAITAGSGMPLYLELMRGGVNTQAVVLRTDQNNHCRAEYRFMVEGWKYDGAGSYCGARIGQSIDITYLASNPMRSCLGDPQEAFYNDLIFALMAALVMPPFAFFMWRKKRESRRPVHGRL